MTDIIEGNKILFWSIMFAIGCGMIYTSNYLWCCFKAQRLAGTVTGTRVMLLSGMGYLVGDLLIPSLTDLGPVHASALCTIAGLLGTLIYGEVLARAAVGQDYVQYKLCLLRGPWFHGLNN